MFSNITHTGIYIYIYDIRNPFPEVYLKKIRAVLFGYQRTFAPVNILHVSGFIVANRLVRMSIRFMSKKSVYMGVSKNRGKTPKNGW